MVGFAATSFYLYVLAYVVAVGGCAVALRRAAAVDDRETRIGLVGLLVSSGGWAAAQLGYVLAPTGTLQYALYLSGLVIGLATIGGWLYFCSAYTGRSLHRNSTWRRAAVAVYVAIVVLKLTNPIHGLYFTTTAVSAPFPYLRVQNGLAHWVVTGLSYVLVSAGFFMLLEQFSEADFDTRPLVALLAATGLPVLFDIVEILSDVLIDISLEPLGVAVFAVGTLYLFEDRFLSVQLSDGVDDPLIYLDGEGRVREANGLARDRFPALEGARGAALDAVLPRVTAAIDDERGVLECTGDEETRYYLVTSTEFARGGDRTGRLVVLSDVTESERQRRELERQNDQLESLAAAMRHELLNTLQIVAGHVDVAGAELEDGDAQSAGESLSTASETTERMQRLVEDFADIARQGRTVEETDPVPFEPAVEEAWETLDTGGVDLVCDGGGRIDADADRFRSLLTSAFRFGLHNGASELVVRLTDDGFSITGDGEEYPELDAETFFEYGSAVPDAEAGIALPSARTLARVHGWTATVDTEYDGGVRLTVCDAAVDPASRDAERVPVPSSAESGSLAGVPRSDSV